MLTSANSTSTQAPQVMCRFGGLSSVPPRPIPWAEAFHVQGQGHVVKNHAGKVLPQSGSLELLWLRATGAHNVSVMGAAPAPVQGRIYLLH